MAERRIPIIFYDDRHLCCPKLGHEVTFEYCRTKQGDAPCRNLLGCWWDHIEVAPFVAEHFGGIEAGEFFDGPAEQVAAVTECIKRASGRERA